MAILVVASLLPLSAFAECDFSTGIEKLPDGRYAYSVECHKRVGKMEKDLKDKDSQIASLNKTIELKDLGLKTQEERADKWMNASFKMEDRVNTIDSLQSKNQWLSFGMGVLVTIGAGWAIGQAAKK